MIEDNTQDVLLSFISRNFLVNKSEIDTDKSLVDMGVIDSMGLIEIASFMENQFSFKVEENHMNRENFGSVIKMVAYIKKQKNHEQ